MTHKKLLLLTSALTSATLLAATIGLVTYSHFRPKSDPDAHADKSRETLVVKATPMKEKLAQGEFFDQSDITHYSRYDLLRIPLMGNLPKFKAGIHDLYQARDTRTTYAGTQMNVWDWWPLTDLNNNIVKIHGHYLVFALVGNRAASYKTNAGQNVADTHIEAFWTDNPHTMDAWHAMGIVKTVPKDTSDALLKRQLAQWSGGTVLKNGVVTMFYTSFDADANDNAQTLAKVNLDIQTSGHGLKLGPNITGAKTVLKPDGEIYQKQSQAKSDGYDEQMFRDPHVFSANGKLYMTFAANLAPDLAPETNRAVFNVESIGGSLAFRTKQRAKLLPDKNNPWHTPSVDYNACFGLVELNADYTVKKVLKPLIRFDTVTDEMERPDIFYHNGRWYLFGITRGYKLNSKRVTSTDSFLLGWSAKKFGQKWQAMGKGAVVLHNTVAWKSREYSYSFYPLNSGSDTLTVLDYFTNSKAGNGWHMTPGRSIQVKLSGTGAGKVVQAKQQGAIS